MKRNMGKRFKCLNRRVQFKKKDLIFHGFEAIESDKDDINCIKSCKSLQWNQLHLKNCLYLHKHDEKGFNEHIDFMKRAGGITFEH